MIMNHVRHIERQICFAPFVHEQTIAFPLDDRIHLEFVFFQLYGLPADRDGMPRGLFPNHIHAYIDGVDVTSSVIVELKKKIAERKPSDVLAQYKIGLDAWLLLARSYGAAYPGDIARDAALATQLVTNPIPESLLDSLGNAQIGSGGCLHIFNFLYQSIDINPVSMWDVLSTHNGSGLPKVDVKGSASPKLVLSSGPCRYFDAAFDPKKFLGQGAVNLRLSLSYHDPLEDKIKEMERKLDRLQKQILARLDTIADACRDGGPFQLAIATLKGSVASLQQDVSSMRADISSNTAQATALQAQAKSLQDAVNQL